MTFLLKCWGFLIGSSNIHEYFVDEATSALIQIVSNISVIKHPIIRSDTDNIVKYRESVHIIRYCGMKYNDPNSMNVYQLHHNGREVMKFAPISCYSFRIPKL